MTNREVMQQALEALESGLAFAAHSPILQNLRTALEQPEQAPVLHKWAALFEDPNNDWQAGYESARRWVLEVGLQSIDTPPAEQQRKPLTDEEIWEIHDRCIPPTEGYVSPVDFARAIEAKLKERNT